MTPMNSSNPITNVIHNGIKQPIRELLQKHFYGAALTLTLTSIDIVAWLGMPSGSTRANKADFAQWVERYIDLKGDTIVTGLEWYGARCGVLHTYGVESDLSRNKGLRIIGYVDDMSPPVRYNKKVSTKLIMVSIRAFIEAFLDGLDRYLIDLYADPTKAKLADERFLKMFHTSPYP
jgi:hypothetical protein